MSPAFIYYIITRLYSWIRINSSATITWKYKSYPKIIYTYIHICLSYTSIHCVYTFDLSPENPFFFTFKMSVLCLQQIHLSKADSFELKRSENIYKREDIYLLLVLYIYTYIYIHKYIYIYINVYIHIFFSFFCYGSNSITGTNYVE